MKKVILVLLISIFGLSFSQEKSETIGSNVSSEEYKKLSDDEKRFVNLLDAATAALKGFYLNDTKTEYIADIHFSTNEKNLVSNSLTFSQKESSDDAVLKAGNSCRVCGLRSAYKCLDQIRASTQGKEEFDVHVRKDGDCVILTW